MNEIDLTKINKKTIFDVNSSCDYYLSPKILKNESLKKVCYFQFGSSDISSRIVYKAVASKATELDLKIVLTSLERSIRNVEVFLEIYILNLNEGNNIKIKPYLEIPQKGIKFEHKVTIGAPNKSWIKYLKSRGLAYNQALKLISKSFITG